MKTLKDCPVCNNRNKALRSLNRKAAGDSFYREAIRHKFVQNIDKGLCENPKCPSKTDSDLDQTMKDFAGDYAWPSNPLKERGRWKNHYHQCVHCSKRLPSQKNYAFEADYVEPELEEPTVYEYKTIRGEQIPLTNPYIQNPIANKEPTPTYE